MVITVSVAVEVVVSPRSGGESDKLGNYYEGLWIIWQMLEVVAGRVDSITVEAVGELGDGVEFILRSEGVVESHQVKRQIRNANDWTLGTLRAKGVLRHAARHTRQGRKFCFASMVPARILDELTGRARRSADIASFVADLGSNKELRDGFVSLCEDPDFGSQSAAWQALQRIQVYWPDERIIRAHNAMLAETLLEGLPPGPTTLVLGEIALTNLGRELDLAALDEQLAVHGIRRIKEARQATRADRDEMIDAWHRAGASKTGDAHAVAGGYANSGVHIGDVNLRTNVPVRTAYRHTVERIRPQLLEGRETELAELAAFCSGASDASGGKWYTWWRAVAWAGKSALMSTFVLDPPPRVRVVSFFVTARLAGQADRKAFVDNVLEQLLALLGEEMPPFLTASTRESYMTGLLVEAAALCRQRGERLVLVVDGLDEDRGVTTSPDSYSIAALLPSHPVEGLRVVVAGRPDPPIPGDVPEDHPLRDPAIVRVLEVSPRARALRIEMERDLKRLLAGTVLEQDLLGLLVAANGGLTAEDLAELIDTGVWEVQDHLTTVAGRSFTRRDSYLVQGSGPDVYLLAHEELQVAAINMLGRARLKVYRDRLHAWADGYRDRKWPEETPEYLLWGYFDVLADANDLDKVVTCATDSARADRMRDLSGGDRVALAEIDRAQSLVLRRQPPDVGMVARLAVHRDRLAMRNSKVPVMLPATLALLGELARAEELAGSMPGPWAQSAAIAHLAEAAVEIGALDRARELAEHVAELAKGIHQPPWPSKGDVLAAVLRSMLAVGDLERAVSFFESLGDDIALAEAVPALVSAMSHRLDIADVDRFVTSIPNGTVRARALLHLADISSSTAYLEQAIALAPSSRRSSRALLAVTATKLLGRQRAEELLPAAVDDPHAAVQDAIVAAAIAIQTGDLDEAITTIVDLDAEGCNSAIWVLAPFLPWDDLRTTALLERSHRGRTARYVAIELAMIGALDQALKLVPEPDDPDLLASLAHCAARQRRAAQARKLIARLWTKIADNQDPSRCVSGWSKLSEAAADAGDLPLAERLVVRASAVVKDKPGLISSDAIADLVYAFDRLERIEEATELAAMISDDHPELYLTLTAEIEITGWESDEEVEEILNRGPSLLWHPTRVPEGSAVDLLTARPWTEALPVLARDHPDLLKTLAAELDFNP